MPAPTTPRSIAIVGGGVAGLAAAHRLTELAPACAWTLYESTDRLGGVLQTTQDGPWRIEHSADNFLTRDPWATNLCQRVGLTDELLPTNTDRRGAMVIHRGRPVRVPKGFVLMSARPVWPTLASPLLSVGAKLRLMSEPFAPRGPGTDESVADFARRRLGREALERLVQPLVGGIYTADPERLSMAATLPQFLEQEREHGSLWRAGRKQATAKSKRESGANYALFMAPRLGLHQLVDAIVARLPLERLRPATKVSGCQRTNAGRWRVRTTADQPPAEYDAIIVATPTHHAATLLNDASRPLSAALGRIEYASSAVVCLGVADTQVARPADAFGFVVPTVEDRRIVAASFSSYKFPDRAPAGHTLVRVFVGGAMQPELAELPDEQLIDLAVDELSDLVGLRGKPLLTRVVRWPRAMPQYHVGHLDRIGEIEQMADELGGLALVGAGYRGVGVPQCIRSGERAAERLLQREAVCTPEPPTS
ncbi:MAG: protoporphyrinogen oxidase [Planctomycetota bacterium]